MARTKDPAVERARRAAIADAVIALMTTRSWRSMTLMEVARVAGVSKGVVTYWFSSKEVLILEAIRRFHARYESRLVEVARDQRPIRDRLTTLIDVAFPDQATLAAELRFHAEVWSFAKENPEVEVEIRSVYADFRAACEALVQVGVAEGYVTNPDLDGLYRFIHALVDGLSLHLAFEPDVDLAAVKGQLLRLIEVWLTAPPGRTGRAPASP